MAQFSVPRADDFTINSTGVSFKEDKGKRTLEGGGRYHWANNSGYQKRGQTTIFIPIEIKNSDGVTIHTMRVSTRLPRNSPQQNWNFSISENKPYNFLKYNALSVNVKFVSGVGSYKPHYPDGRVCNKNCPDSSFNGLLSSNIQIGALIKVVDVQEETRLANIETKRLEDIEEKRLQDIEKKRLEDIEKSRILKLQNDKLLLTEIRFSGYQVEESRLLQLLNQDYEELENFYETDDLPKLESIPVPEIIPSIESIESIDSMSKQIPLETTAPILLILGVGLVSYYLLKGNKK